MCGFKEEKNILPDAGFSREVMGLPTSTPYMIGLSTFLFWINMFCERNKARNKHTDL